MKKIIFLIAATALVFGCIKEEAGKQPGSKKQLITGTVRGSAEKHPSVGDADFVRSQWIDQNGRVALGDNGRDLTWEVDDQIKVFKQIIDGWVSIGVFDAESGGSATTTFSSSTADAIVAGASYMAAYPASAFSDDNVPNFTLAQTQSTAGNSSHLKDYILIGADTPVEASAAESVDLVFDKIYNTLFEFSVTNTDEGDNAVKLRKITIEDVTDGNMSFAGPGMSVFGAVSLTVTDQGLLPTDAEAKYWLTTLCVAPEATQLAVRLYTDKGVREFVKPVPTGGFAAGLRYTVTLDWKDGAPVAIQTATLAEGNINMPTGGEVTVKRSDSPVGSELDKAFDHNLATDFVTGTGAFDLVWAGSAAKPINYYAIVSSATGNASDDPKTWSFYGSDDNESWTLLDRQENQIFAARSERKGYKFEYDSGNEFFEGFVYYKLSIEENNGGTSTRMAEVLTSAPYVVRVEQSGTKFLTSGTVTVEYSNMEPGMSFEKAIDSDWKTPWGIYHTSFSIVWAPDRAMRATQYTVRSAPKDNSLTNQRIYDPKSWKFYGSNDMEIWELIDEQDHQYSNREQAKNCDVSANTKYFSYYKWEISENNGGIYTRWGEMAIAQGTVQTTAVIPQTLADVLAMTGKGNAVDISPLGDNAFATGVNWMNTGKVTAAEIAWLKDPNATILTYKPTDHPDWYWKEVLNKDNIVLYPSGGRPSPADVNQHSMGDCSMLAAFASLAYVYPDFIMSIIHDNGDYTYDIDMYDPKGNPITITLGASFLASGNGAWQCVTGKSNKITWSTLMEKAIMKYNMVYRTKNSISVEGIFPSPALAPFTGDGRKYEFGNGKLLPEEVQAVMKIFLESGFLITCGFRDVLAIDGGKTVKLHTFTVMHSAKPDAVCQVRNPWGFSSSSSVDDGIYYFRDFKTIKVKDITDITYFTIVYPGAANPGLANPGVFQPYVFDAVLSGGTRNGDGQSGIRMDEYYERMANDGRLIRR